MPTAAGLAPPVKPIHEARAPPVSTSVLNPLWVMEGPPSVHQPPPGFELVRRLVGPDAAVRTW
jgi:hypothetical protein